MEEINNDMYRKMKFYYILHYKGSMSRKGVRVMVFNATCNNISFISWRSVLLVDETGVSGVNHRPVTSH
jgi:hypothetical protein